MKRPRTQWGSLLSNRQTPSSPPPSLQFGPYFISKRVFWPHTLNGQVWSFSQWRITWSRKQKQDQRGLLSSLCFCLVLVLVDPKKKKALVLESETRARVLASLVTCSMTFDRSCLLSRPKRLCLQRHWIASWSLSILPALDLLV